MLVPKPGRHCVDVKEQCWPGELAIGLLLDAHIVFNRHYAFDSARNFSCLVNLCL